MRLLSNPAVLELLQRCTYLHKSIFVVRHVRWFTYPSVYE
uniref:Uncharacterized protein n=1 Tax=Rhizophora mucronata TaxID=61149 RepID=A0A2P2NJI2_RHIMU